MQKRLVLILNVLVLMAILLVLGLLFLRSYTPDNSTEEQECVDVNNVASLVYDMCYDAYTKKIYVSVDRKTDSYQINSIAFSFFDTDNQVYQVTDVPGHGESRAYKIDAEKNPQNLSIRLNVVKDFSAPTCSTPRIFLVKYCPARSNADEDVNAQISPFIDVPADSFVKLSKPDSPGDSDILSTGLLDKEAAWESKCKSSWDCADWGSCIGGLERRTCADSEDCYVPTGKPETVRYCDNTCVENWQCIWSECSNGVTTPSCKDLNSCGTKDNIPTSLPCDDKSDTCVPDVQCSDWTDCKVDYNFLDLVGKDITRLNATRSRVCSDVNRCSSPKLETQQCGVNLDIYTKEFNKCGKDYIGIYNQLDDSLIARVDVGTKDNPALNLFLDEDADSTYCDYCFNGRMDGDETGIDCGGGCMSCEDKYGPVEYTKSPWFTRLFG